ncbi:MAG: hypothetical protein ACK5TP_03310, partial [bacterium]
EFGACNHPLLTVECNWVGVLRDQFHPEVAMLPQVVVKVGRLARVLAEVARSVRAMLEECLAQV